MGEQIMVDGRTLSGVDRFGEWLTTDLVGWWDTPERKTRDVEREWADGDYDLPEYYASRRVTISGRVRTKSHELQHEAMNWLAGTLSAGPGRMLVSGHGPDQWATAKLDGSVRMTPLTDTYVQWQIPLKFPDSYKYGALHTYRGSSNSPAVLSHHGNVGAWPVVTVSGNLPGGYKLLFRARTVTVTRPLVSGQPHVIDFRSQRLRIDGGLIFSAFSDSAFVHLKPGPYQTMTLRPVGSGSGSLAVDVYDTFV